MSAGIELVLGAVLLVAGRKLFWLLVAGVGFIIGLALVPLILPGRPEWVVLVGAVVLALAGAMLAVLAQKMAVSVVGFLGGGWLALWLLRLLAGDPDGLQWIAFIAGGIVGVVLLLTLFEWGLVLLSSLIGASFLVSGLPRNLSASAELMPLLFLVLFGAGVLIQARSVKR